MSVDDFPHIYPLLSKTVLAVQIIIISNPLDDACLFDVLIKLRMMMTHQSIDKAKDCALSVHFVYVSVAITRQTA